MSRGVLWLLESNCEIWCQCTEQILLLKATSTHFHRLPDINVVNVAEDRPMRRWRLFILYNSSLQKLRRLLNDLPSPSIMACNVATSTDKTPPQKLLLIRYHYGGHCRLTRLTGSHTQLYLTCNKQTSWRVMSFRGVGRFYEIHLDPHALMDPVYNPNISS